MCIGDKCPIKSTRSTPTSLDRGNRVEVTEKSGPDSYSAGAAIGGGSLFKGNTGLRKKAAEVKKLFERGLSPQFVLSTEERIDFYRRIPVEIRTLLSDKLVKIGELREFFLGLEPSDFAEKPEVIHGQLKELSLLTFDVINAFTCDGLHFQNAISRLIKEARAGKDVTAIRMDLDITSLNKLDQTGSLADAYLPAFGEWLNRNIANSRYLPRGISPMVVQLPDRTSFLIVGANSGYGKVLMKFVELQLRDFERDMKEGLQEFQDSGKINPDINIADLHFGGVIHSSTLKLADLKKMSVAGIIDGATKELIRLSAETTWLKAFDPDAKLIIGGFKLYSRDVVEELDGTPMRASLQIFVDSGRGFIPMGIFGYEDVADPVKKQALEHLNIPLKVGQITRPSNGGAMLEKFGGMTITLITNPEKAYVEPLFSAYKTMAESLTSDLISLGAEARTGLRYRATLRDMSHFAEQIAVHNSLLKEAGLPITYDKLFMIEIDDGRAFNIAYPKTDKVDTNFQMVNKLVFDTAAILNYFVPIVMATGDQILVSLPSFDADGKKVNPAQFANEYQKNVKSWYESAPYEGKVGMTFQPYAKVVGEDGKVVRLPVWVNGAGEFSVGKKPLPDYLPFMKTVTATVAWADVPNIATAEDVKVLRDLSHKGFSFIDSELKIQIDPSTGKPTYYKEGAGVVPEDYENGTKKFSMLTEEDLELFKGPMITPWLEHDVFSSLEIYPMPEPPDPSDYLLIFTPAKSPKHPSWVWGGDGWIIQPDPVEPEKMPEPLITPAKPAIDPKENAVLKAVEKVPPELMLWFQHEEKEAFFWTRETMNLLDGKWKELPKVLPKHVDITKKEVQKDLHKIKYELGLYGSYYGVPTRFDAALLLHAGKLYVNGKLFDGKLTPKEIAKRVHKLRPFFARIERNIKADPESAFKKIFNNDGTAKATTTITKGVLAEGAILNASSIKIPSFRPTGSFGFRPATSAAMVTGTFYTIGMEGLIGYVKDPPPPGTSFFGKVGHFFEKADQGIQQMFDGIMQYHISRECQKGVRTDGCRPGDTII